jgi:hypothetical protein
MEPKPQQLYRWFRPVYIRGLGGLMVVGKGLCRPSLRLLPTSTAYVYCLRLLRPYVYSDPSLRLLPTSTAYVYSEPTSTQTLVYVYCLRVLRPYVYCLRLLYSPRLAPLALVLLLLSLDLSLRPRLLLP